MACCSSSTSPQSWTSVYSYHLIALLLVHWQVPFDYVCVSPLDHVLLLPDAVPFVCDMTFMFDMVHMDAFDSVGRTSTPKRVGFYCGVSCGPRIVQMSGQEAGSLSVSASYHAASRAVSAFP